MGFGIWGVGVYGFRIWALWFWGFRGLGFGQEFGAKGLRFRAPGVGLQELR